MICNKKLFALRLPKQQNFEIDKNLNQYLNNKGMREKFEEGYFKKTL